MTILQGIVASGVGHGAFFMNLEWVRTAIRRSLGFDPYPGTLNVRLVNGDGLVRWRELSKEVALLLTPSPPGECGGWLIPITLAQDIPAAVIVPDVTKHGDDVLEVIAAVHLRSRLGLQDGDLLNFICPDAGGNPAASRSLRTVPYVPAARVSNGIPFKASRLLPFDPESLRRFGERAPDRGAESRRLRLKEGGQRLVDDRLTPRE